MIEIHGLTKSVPTSEGVLTILNSVDLSIAEAETVAIVGASGSGKSTLLGLMAGLDAATSGDVLLGGHSLAAMDEEQRAVLRGQIVGFVFQSFQLLPSLTALENVMLPIELKGDAQARAKATALLERVGLAERITHYPNQRLVFILPLLGICFLIRSTEMLDIFGYRGGALTQAIMAMSIAVVGSYWLAHNLFKETGLTRELLGIESNRLVGAYTVTILMGVVLGLYWLIGDLKQLADLSETSIAVMEFPLLLIGSYGLITFSQRVKMYRARLILEKKITPISDRLSSSILMLTMATGLAGPISAAIGYSNIGSKLVFATILTLAVLFALFVVFTMIAYLFSEIIIKNQNKDVQESTPKGSLFRVFLAFILACCAIPLLALIWGARVVDIQDVWLSLKDGVVLGDTRVSISDFITFIIIFSIGYTLTRLLQSALRLSVLPNTKIDTGAQNALVTGVGYIGIFFAGHHQRQRS